MLDLKPAHLDPITVKFHISASSSAEGRQQSTGTEHGVNQDPRTPTQALPQAQCMTLGRVLELSRAQFPKESSQPQHQC